MTLLFIGHLSSLNISVQPRVQCPPVSRVSPISHYRVSLENGEHCKIYPYNFPLTPSAVEWCKTLTKSRWIKTSLNMGISRQIFCKICSSWAKLMLHIISIYILWIFFDGFPRKKLMNKRKHFSLLRISFLSFANIILCPYGLINFSLETVLI